MAGWGSGIVHVSKTLPPLWALGDELGIPRGDLKLDAPVVHACNKDGTNCISYVGAIDTLLPTDTRNEAIDEETKLKIQSLHSIHFDETLIFAGVQSGEADDRANLTWNSEVLDQIDQFKNKGKIIGLVTAPGPILLNNLAKVADALIFNVMPGQQYATAMMNILFGRVSPSGKLTFTMPNIENEQKMTER